MLGKKAIVLFGISTGGMRGVMLTAIDSRIKASALGLTLSSSREDREDVIEPAIESALAQSAEVLTVRHDDELRPLGSIAALLRF